MFSKISDARHRNSLCLSVVLVLAACGGGSDPGPPETLPESPQPPPEVLRLASGYTDLAEGITSGQRNWPDGSGTGAPIGGVGCATVVRYHIHSLVSIYKDGVRMAVPASIGLKGCTYEMHTHDASGLVHIETDAAKKFTLRQFFDLWGQPVSRTGVAGLSGPARFYIIQNETVTPFDGNPADIEFAGRKEIVIITGRAPLELPKYRWPSGL
jgi:hypothetical protein